jgi:hypothetical protein
MSQFAFGAGQVFGVRSDIVTGTPVRFGTLQDVSVDISMTMKELYGQYQFPVAIARGQGKINCKAKFGRFNGLVFDSLFFGTSVVVGKGTVADAEAGTIPGTPYAITVANGATWVDDLGVVDGVTLLPLTKVASAPATGQYMAAAGGIYTFAAADTTKTVQISYTYTTATGGNKTTITNVAMGTTPTFMAVLYAFYGANQWVLKLNKCVSTKLAWATKLEDFTVPELDFSAFDDGTFNIGTLYMIE